MKPKTLSTAIAALAFILTASAHGQTAPPTTPWSGSFNWDLRVNKPFATLDYSVGIAHSPLILPAWSFSAVTFAGSYVGSNGSGAGAGLQISTVYKSVTFSAFAGEAMFAGQTGFDPIIGVGITVPLK